MPTVELRNDLSGSDGVPHTYLAVLEEGVDPVYAGFEPVETSLVNIGRISGEFHEYNQFATKSISITNEQYERLVDNIEVETADPPYYNVFTGSQCSAWALEQLNDAGILSSEATVDIINSYQTFTVNPYALGVDAMEQNFLNSVGQILDSWFSKDKEKVDLEKPESDVPFYDKDHNWNNSPNDNPSPNDPDYDDDYDNPENWDGTKDDWDDVETTTSEGGNQDKDTQQDNSSPSPNTSTSEPESDGDSGDSSDDGDSSGGDDAGGGEDSGSDDSGGYDDDEGCPVILDLEGDGIKLISLNESNTYFDFDNDGLLERTAWTKDAILMFDEHQDNQITHAREIAFSQYTTDNDTDLEALATYFDNNQDQVLDEQDPDFDQFRVWIDHNTNGLVDTGETQGLRAVGISSIGLVSNQHRQIQEDGSTIFGEASFTKTDGATGVVADVAFRYEDDDPLDPLDVDNPECGRHMILQTDQTQYLRAEELGIKYLDASRSTGDVHVVGFDPSVDYTLIGGQGHDRFYTGAGDDVLIGGFGDDLLVSYDGDDYLDGGEGDDVINGGYGNNVINGGSGNDSITTSLGNNVVYGGSGDDHILSFSGDDVIDGGTGRDTIHAGTGNDLIYLNGDNDLIRGGPGADTFKLKPQQPSQTIDIYNTPGDYPSEGHIDNINQILDFSATEGDVIDFSAVSEVRSIDDLHLEAQLLPGGCKYQINIASRRTSHVINLIGVEDDNLQADNFVFADMDEDPWYGWEYTPPEAEGIDYFETAAFVVDDQVVI